MIWLRSQKNYSSIIFLKRIIFFMATDLIVEPQCWPAASCFIFLKFIRYNCIDTYKYFNLASTTFLIINKNSIGKMRYSFPVSIFITIRKVFKIESETPPEPITGCLRLILNIRITRYADEASSTPIKRTKRNSFCLNLIRFSIAICFMILMSKRVSGNSNLLLESILLDILSILSSIIAKFKFHFLKACLIWKTFFFLPCEFSFSHS